MCVAMQTEAAIVDRKRRIIDIANGHWFKDDVENFACLEHFLQYLLLKIPPKPIHHISDFGRHQLSWFYKRSHRRVLLPFAFYSTHYGHPCDRNFVISRRNSTHSIYAQTIIRGSQVWKIMRDGVEFQIQLAFVAWRSMLLCRKIICRMPLPMNIFFKALHKLYIIESEHQNFGRNERVRYVRYASNHLYIYREHFLYSYYKLFTLILTDDLYR